MRENQRGSERTSVDLQLVLDELGSVGRYQLYTMLLVMVPIVLTAVYDCQYVFNAGDVDYRCLVPECELAPGTHAAGEWAAWALVPGERCHRWRPVSEGGSAVCSQEAFSAFHTVACTAWVYSNKDTIVGEFELGCQDWKRTLVGTVHSAGLCVALPITGLFSDAYGRRLAFIVTAVSRSATGLARAFSPNYVTYVLLEFADSALGAGTYSTGFILALEMVGTKQRVIAGNLMSSGFACGLMLLALVAWAVPHWRTLTLILYVPSVAFLSYFCCLHESVRWLVHKKRKGEATRIIFKAAKMNRKQLSSEVVRNLLREHEEREADRQEHEQQSTQHGIIKDLPPLLIHQVLRSRVLVTRIFICSFWWMTTTFTYYGLSINSVALIGNKYVNYILTSLVEIPGYFLSVVLLDRFGRKASIMTAFLMCSLMLLVLPFVPKGVRLWLTLGGKLFISMVFSSLYIYTVELYPTSVRHSLMAASSMIGRVGSLLAPQTPLLMAIWEPLPYLAFGAMSALAGLLLALTPETLHTRLPDTVDEVETVAHAHRQRQRQRHPVDSVSN